MSKEKHPPVEELIKRGSLGVLALGYRGVESWKENRESPPEKPTPQEPEEKKKNA